MTSRDSAPSEDVTVVNDPKEDDRDDVRAADMQCKDPDALQAAFEENMKEKYLDLLKDLSQEDCISTGDIPLNQMQIDDYNLIGEENENNIADLTSSDDRSKVAVFSNAWYAVERILKSTDIDSISAPANTDEEDEL